MKKILMAILTVIVAIIISAIVLYINVFSKKAQENISKSEKTLINSEKTQEQITGYEKQIADAEEKAKKAIQEEITEEKIEEAITYIEENIEVTAEEKNITTIEEMAYYGAYLKELVKYEDDEKKSEITVLGENTLSYSKEALKFIENNEKTKENDEVEKIEETIPEESTTTENIPEAVATPIATPITEPSETPVVINVIEVNTSTTLEKAKTKVRGSISKINNLNRKKLVTELKERIDNSSQI